MTAGAPPKSLKDQVRWQLWLTIAANFVVFYGVAQTDALQTSGLPGLLHGAVNLLPVGLALIVTTVANGLLDANMKARLVFARWTFPLPGHRAFSVHGPNDPRVDMAQIQKVLKGEIPSAAAEQNRAWYRLYKAVEHDPPIAHAHREFLFTRDYAAFSFLFLLGFGAASFFLIGSRKVALIYCAILLAQFLIVRHSAATYGKRFVTTVLAIVQSKSRAASLGS